MNSCNVCEYVNLIEVKFNNIFLRTDSKLKDLHNYKSYICKNCGVLNQHPQMSEKELSNYYNSNYRSSGYEMQIGDKLIDFPLKFHQTGISFQRFFYFNKILKTNNINIQNKTVLDYGSYQGAFLYSCKKIYNCKTIGYDYNVDGLNFSKEFLNIDKTYETKNIYSDQFDEKIDLCTLIHTFEHVNKPNEFLNHLHKNILNQGDLVYIEVPDVETYHFADPTHCFMYSLESLKYILNKNNFEILTIEKNRFYRPKDGSTSRRFYQFNIHCLARKVEKVDYNTKPMQGMKIYQKTEKKHRIIFDKFLIKSTLTLLTEIFNLINLFISRCISIFSYEKSVDIYEKINNFKKKVYNKIKKLFKL